MDWGEFEHWGDDGWRPEDRAWFSDEWTPSRAADWKRAGFRASEARTWERAGVSPSDAIGWDGWHPKHATGFIKAEVTSRAARPWRQWEVENALPWIRAGFGAGEAARLTGAGWAASDALEWRSKGWLLREAAPWARLGWRSDDAREWHEEGWLPSEATPWFALGWSPELAATWRRRKFTAAEARDWADAGLDPVRASVWRSHGWDPEEVSEWLPSAWDPKESRSWAHHGWSAVDAQVWRDLAHEPAQAVKWRESGCDTTTASEWQRHGFGPGAAAPWIARGWAPHTAAAWNKHSLTCEDTEWLRLLGDEPSEAARWSQKGFTPAEAAAWVSLFFDLSIAAQWHRLGVTPSSAVEWHAAGFSPRSAAAWIAESWTPVEAARWKVARFKPCDTAWPTIVREPAEARRWARAGFGPTAASSWLAAGFAATDAGRWLKAGWEAEPARAWTDAGWSAPDVAAAWLRHGWDPHEAATASADGQGPRLRPVPTVAVPAGFPPPKSTAPHRQRDSLLGTPRSKTAARVWSRGLATADSSPVPPEGWTAPAVSPRLRHRPDDIEGLSAFALQPMRSVSGVWEAAARSLVTNSVPVLIAPERAESLLQGEDPPGDLVDHIRLPYPIISIVLAADFVLPANHLGLPTWSGLGPGSGLSFEPWVTTLAADGGAIFGITIWETSNTLDDRVLWWIATQGSERFVLPACRSASALGGAVINMAAAVSFDPRIARRNSPPTSRLGTRHLGEAQLPPAQLVHEIRLERPKNVRYADIQLTGRTRTSHIRRGHWRRSRVGAKDDWKYEWRWIQPTSVNGGSLSDAPNRVYRLVD